MEYVHFDGTSLSLTSISIFILIFISYYKEKGKEVLSTLKSWIGFHMQQLDLGLCVLIWVGCLGSHLQSKEIESLLSSVESYM